MGLEESPHCPFDVMEACRTGDLDTGSGDRGTRFRLPPGRREQGSGTSTHAGHMVGARLVVAVTVYREGSERSVEAAGSGRATTPGWTLEEGQPRHRQRGPGRRLVAVAVAVGREGSKRSVVAAAGVMVVRRRRWIKTGATWEARAEGQVGPMGERRRPRTGNEDEITEAGILAKTAEVARQVSAWHGAGRDWPPRTLRRGRRRQASARPLVGPPNALPVLSAPGWWICLF